MAFIVCLSLFGYCLALTRFTKQPIEYTPFFVVSTIILLLYCFAYWHFLQVGTNGVIIAGAFLLLSSPFYLQQDKHKLWEKYFTPGIIISSGYLILFLLMASHVHLSAWDEFTQWGPHSKLMFLNNGFVTASDVTIMKSYPVGGALFQYLFFRIPGYSEGSAYVAQCLLTMAPFSVLLTKFKWHQWHKAFIAYSATLLVLVLMHLKIGPVDTLYMDDVSAIFFGMAIVAYINSKRSLASILYLIPVIAALVSFKPKLFPFVMLIAFTILVINTGDYFKKQINARAFLLRILAVCALPVTAFTMTQSWMHYLHSIQVHAARNLDITVDKITNALFSPPGSVQHTIVVNYLHALMPAAIFVFVMLLLNTLAYLFYQSKSQRRTIVITTLTLLVGFIAFLAGLLLMYLFTFTHYEAIRLASMDRYLNIFYLAWTLITLNFLYDSSRHLTGKVLIKFDRTISALAVIGLLVFTGIHLFKTNSTWQLRQPIIKIANAVKNKTSAHAKIFMIWQNSSGLERAMMIYELTPRSPNMACTSFGKKYSKADVWTCDISGYKLLQEIHHYHYLLLAYTDRNFWYHYQAFFPDREISKPLVTYHICVKKGFNQFGKRGCHMQVHHAYLFKILHNHGRILFKNMRG